MDGATAATGFDALMTGYIAGGVTVGVVAGRVIFGLVQTKIPKLNGQAKIGLTTEQAQQLHDLSTSHKKFDEDGTPLWYVPRSWGSTLTAILVELRKMNGKLVSVPGMAGALDEHRREEAIAHTSIQGGQKDIKEDVGDIKDDVGSIKSDVSELRSDVNDLQDKKQRRRL